MSNTKHNLLHFLKIITAPIYAVLVVLVLILFVLSLILELAGFKVEPYWAGEGDFTSWWEKLP
jgi:uncharacterized membrane protein